MEKREAMLQLKQQGYKPTNRRQAIFNCIHEQKRFMSAKDVYDELQAAFPTLSLDTIYRNLMIFTNVGLLETTEIQGERKYRLLCCAHNSHHHHMICTSCGKTIMIEAECPIELIKMPDDFVVTGHKFEIYGCCSDCVPEGATSYSKNDSVM
ncbi:Fur family transcriptional regulator [Desulfuribacillus stibiiarsenatis]|uniref:Fur family transcriptional regulator n=1 Tax=Desulfuribacillus stibiiarsenatis TaxID=1390249 RepID=UPI0009F1926F|nr:Fur family transcriptional regulator [Desulfuribacillus stibiiarsenatis]